jgi:hypothetical protein
LRAAVCQRRFFNADWRVFEFDEERIKESREKGEGIAGKGDGLFYLKEWEMTEEKGGGMGRSEKGIFGPESADFPAEVEEEETKEVPARNTAA